MFKRFIKNSRLVGGGALSFNSSVSAQHISCKVEKLCYNSDMELHNYGRKQAFTLAEVLITLGIIGVVAAITMPTLITKIQDRQYIAKWKKAYSVINNAFMQIQFEDGITITSGSGLSLDFQQKFMEKLNVLDCRAIYNLEDSICNIKSVSNLKGAWYTSKPSPYMTLGRAGTLSGYNFRQTAFLLNDGTLIQIGQSLGGPWVVVDVNNYSAGPNEVGRDVYIIRVMPSSNQYRLLPLGADGTFDKKSNGDVCECSKTKGAPSASYIALPDANKSTEIVRGGCCSAYYLYEK